ncbi:MAG: Type 1 glutamine amidotransferase-like domain-containing protein [Ignavibacteriales bacterium]|nr:Type 1 glutamine amidotransferase-like domain-containing protein [Ignavibacteriales bacterium]
MDNTRMFLPPNPQIPQKFIYYPGVLKIWRPDVTGKEFYEILLFLVFVLAIVGELMPQGYICAVGGGSEGTNDWNRAPYKWIVEKADSGKIVVLSVNDETTWIPDYFRSLGASTSYNLRINSRTLANSQAMYDSIVASAGVFIKGGDQYNYINYWKGTLTEAAIKVVFNRGGVVSGTSAGAMVLGEHDLSAKYGTYYPDDALSNPFINQSHVESDFLKLIPGVLFDTHVIERARQGRMVPLFVKLQSDGINDVTIVGIDDRTAICISPDGTGRVMGSGAVAIYRIDSITNISSTQTAYRIENLLAHQLVAGWEYDFINKQIKATTASTRPFVISSPGVPIADITLTGTGFKANVWTSVLSTFLQSINSSRIVVLTNSTYLSQANLLVTALSSLSHSAEILNYSSNSETDTSFTSALSGSTALFVVGDDLTGLKPLLNSGSVCGGILRTKLQQPGWRVFAFGETGKLFTSGFSDNLTSDIYAAYRGKMTFATGLNSDANLVYQSTLFDDSDLYENRMCSALWAMFKGRLRFGMYGNGTTAYSFRSSDSSVTSSNFPLFLFDASGSTLCDSSVYRATSSIAPRQVIAINNLRISATNIKTSSFSFSQRKFVESTTGIEDEDVFKPENKQLTLSIFPNPAGRDFSVSVKDEKTTISRLEVFSITGERVFVTMESFLDEGVKSILVNSSRWAAGTYLVRAFTPNGTLFGKVIIN